MVASLSTPKWSGPSREIQTRSSAGEKTVRAIFALLVVVVIAGGVFFASRNLRLGRGDRRGAVRLVLLALTLGLVNWIFTEHHVATFWELGLFVTSFSFGLSLAGLLGVLYIALEPFVRRRWPQMLVSWTRALSGDWRDPVVGRDVLLGCVVGVVFTCLGVLSVLMPGRLGYAAEMPLPGLTLNN